MFGGIFALIGSFAFLKTINPDGEQFFYVRDITFGVLFGVISIALFYRAFVDKKKISFTEANQLKHPHRPEKWRKDWENGFTLSELKEEFLDRMVLLTFLAFTLPLLINLFQSGITGIEETWNDPKYGPTSVIGTAVMFLFLFVVVGIVYRKVIKNFFQGFKYRKAKVSFPSEMKTGEDLSLNIELSPKLARQSLSAKLICREVVPQMNYGKVTLISEVEKVLWESEQEMIACQNAKGTVSFSPPQNLPQTKLNYPKYEWVLHLKSKTNSYEAYLFLPIGHKKAEDMASA